MTTLIFLSLLVCCLGQTKVPPVGQGDETKSPSELVAKWDFKDSKEKVLVFFYAPWCGACKKFSEDWTKTEGLLAQHLKTTQLNCDLNKEDGKEARYTGPRDVATLVAWALTTTPTEKFVPGKNSEVLKAREEAQAKRVPWETYDKLDHVTVCKKVTPWLTCKVIQPKEFKTAIASGMWLVKLHIGSGFDQDIIPTIVAVSEEIKDTMKLGVVNVYETPEITDQLDIYGFPTLALFKEGKFIAIFPGSKITKFAVLAWLEDASSKLKEGL